MKKMISKILSGFMVFCTVLALCAPAVSAAETDTEVANVIAQLEAIDTLQQMQAKRYTYRVTNSHYDTGKFNEANIAQIAAEHENARMEYEKYVAEMFAARAAAQKAYDDLSDAKKAAIDATLVAKLSNELATEFKSGTYAVTPSDNEYVFEAVKGGTGYGYEISNHMVSGEIPQTFILVNTSDGATSWTPNGKYAYGESNYEVTYCCDVETPLAYATDYKRINLEDSNYYGKLASEHIRAILQNSYPYVTVDEMKANLIAAGMDESFVNSLTRGDMIAAVQMAVWTYANSNDGAKDGLGYFASVDVPKNTGIYFTPLHDYSNENWNWTPGKRQRSYDARAEYRVNNLAYYLCTLPGVKANEDQLIISDVQVARAELIDDEEGIYNVGMYVYLNDVVDGKDNIKITATSGKVDENGAFKSKTATTSKAVTGDDCFAMYVDAEAGDTIEVVVEGTQHVAKGVYFYQPEGGRDASQSLVGVGEGTTPVKAVKSFEFKEDIKKGIRIYKADLDTKLPISDIEFNIYKIEVKEGTTLNEKPSKDEIATYVVEKNHVKSVTTDVTGYAALELEDGTYIVTETQSEKVVAPVDPFYIQVPTGPAIKNEDESVPVEVRNIVSVYPKNELVPPPEEPPILPPTPGNVKGSFEILKHAKGDEQNTLRGARFQVYRAATAEDLKTETLVMGGIEYAAVPVTVDGKELILTTGADGRVTCEDILCGTYFLKEVKAPLGYKLLDEAVSVTVTPNTLTSGKVVVKIANERGFELPETGGIGTTWMTVIGGVLMSGSGICFMKKKRKDD